MYLITSISYHWDTCHHPLGVSSKHCIIISRISLNLPTSQGTTSQFISLIDTYRHCIKNKTFAHWNRNDELRYGITTQIHRTAHKYTKYANYLVKRGGDKDITLPWWQGCHNFHPRYRRQWSPPREMVNSQGSMQYTYYAFLFLYSVVQYPSLCTD